MLATQFDSMTQPQRQSQPGQQESRQAEIGRQKAKHSRWDRVSMFACIVVCTTAGWFLASTSAQADGLNQQIYQLQSQIKQAAAVNASYSAKLGALTQPAHILTMAAKMGMKQAHTLNIPAQSSAGSN